MKSRSFISCIVFMAIFALVLPALCQDVKEYTVNKVKGTPPTIDGNFTEDEWAGSTWTDEFYGLDLDPNAAEFKGARVDSVVNYKWRALWDEDYLYLLLTCDLKYLNPNGQIWTVDGEVDLTDPTQILTVDDMGYAGWGSGTNLDFEAFILPNWTEDLGNDTTLNPACYQLCYFPLKAGIDPSTGEKTPSNLGVRGKSGPPFFYSGYSGLASQRPGTLVVTEDPAATFTVDWQPITDPAIAQQKAVKPLAFACLSHDVAGAKLGTDVVAKPVFEIAFPFSEFSLASSIVTINGTDPNTGDPVTEQRSTTIDETAPEGLYMFVQKDAQGHYVKAGNKWLLNICAYTDGVIFADNSLAYITWNQMVPGGFHNWPKGILTFAAPVNVGEWMMY